MPILDLNAKLEFSVDQLTIDRVEALAAIDGLDLNAWFRRLVDALVAQGSRHMGIDHVDIEEVRKPVLDIIKWISEQVHPLRAKARDLLDKISVSLSIKKAEAEITAPKKESTAKKLVKKIRGKKGKEILPEVEVEVEVEPDTEPEIEIEIEEVEIEPEEALEVIEDALEEAKEEDAEKTKEIKRLKNAIAELEKT